MRVPTGRLRIVSTQPTEVTEVQEGPSSPGRYIREARLRRGVSIEQLALETKIPRPSLEALEEDRFSALPGPVFVRGFFRCCARALSVDPETVAGLLHQHLRAQTAGAQRQRPATIQAVASVRGANRPAGRAEAARPRVAREPESATRPAALATGPVTPVAAGLAASSAPMNSGAAMQAVHRVGAQAMELLHRLHQIPQSRALMWIAVCLVVAVIAVTAFALAGGHVTPPHS